MYAISQNIEEEEEEEAINSRCRQEEQINL